MVFFSFKCKRCVNNIQTRLPPEDSDCTSDLSQWFHCASNRGLPDTVLSQAWDIVKSVSFVFHHRSAATHVQESTKGVEKLGDEQTSSGKSKINDSEEEFVEDDDNSDEDFVL